MTEHRFFNPASQNPRQPSDSIERSLTFSCDADSRSNNLAGLAADLWLDRIMRPLEQPRSPTPEPSLAELSGMTAAMFENTMNDPAMRTVFLTGLIHALNADNYPTRNRASQLLRRCLTAQPHFVFPFLNATLERGDLTLEQRTRITQELSRRTTRDGITQDCLGRILNFNATDGRSQVVFSWNPINPLELQTITTNTAPEQNENMLLLRNAINAAMGFPGRDLTTIHFERRHNGWEVWQPAANGDRIIVGTAALNDVALQPNGTLSIRWLPTGTSDPVVARYTPRRN